MTTDIVISAGIDFSSIPAEVMAAARAIQPMGAAFDTMRAAGVSAVKDIQAALSGLDFNAIAKMTAGFGASAAEMGKLSATVAALDGTIGKLNDNFAKMAAGHAQSSAKVKASIDDEITAWNRLTKEREANAKMAIADQRYIEQAAKSAGDAVKRAATESQAYYADLFGIGQAQVLSGKARASYENFWSGIIDAQERGATRAAAQSQASINALLGVDAFPSLSGKQSAAYESWWERQLSTAERGAAAVAAAEAKTAQASAATAAKQKIADWDALAKDREATAAMVIAAEKNEQKAVDSTAQKLAALRSQVDPTGVALERLAAGQKLLNAEFAAGRVDPTRYKEMTAAIEQHRTVLERSTISQKAMTNAVGLTSNQMRMLAPQINDVVSGLLMGQPPMMIFTQQAGQLVQAWQMGAAEGQTFGSTVSKAMGAVLSPTGAVVAAFALVAATAALTALRISDIAAEGRKYGEMLRVLSPQLHTTAADLRLMSFAVANAGLSRSDATAAIMSVIQTGKVQSKALVQQIASESADLAAVMGGSAADWAKKLAEATGKGAEGISELLKDIPGVSAAALKSARNLELAGDRAGALAAAHAEIQRTFGGAAERMKSDWAKAMTALGEGWDSLLEHMATSSAANVALKFANAMRDGIQYQLAEKPVFSASTLRMGEIEKELSRLQSFLAAEAGNEVDPAAVKAKDRIAVLTDEYHKLADAAIAAGKAAQGVPAAIVSAPLQSTAPQLTQPDVTKLNLATEAMNRQALAAKLLSQNVGAAGQATAGARISLAEIARGLEGFGAETAKTILTSKDFGETLKKLPPELQQLYASTKNEAFGRLAVGIASANAQMTIQQRGMALTAQAYRSGYEVINGSMNSYARAMSLATEATLKAQAQQKALASGSSAEAEYRALLTDEALKQQVAVAQLTLNLDHETQVQQGVIAATQQGVTARTQAVQAATIAKDTSALVASADLAERNGQADLAEQLRDTAKAYGEKKRAADEATLQNNIVSYTDELKFQNRLLREQALYVGAGDKAQAELAARQDIVKMLRQQGYEYEKLSPAAQKLADEAARQAMENAAIEQGIKRQGDAWSKVGQIGENAFTRVGDAITNAIVSGQAKAINLGTILKSVAASAISDFAKLGAVDIAHVFGLQQSKGGMLDLFSGSSSSAQGQSGGLMSNSNTLSLGSKLLPDSWFSGLKSSIDNWAYNSLGIGSMATSTTTLTTSASGGLASSLGVAPVPGGVSNAAVAGSTTATSGTLTGLTSYLGAAGIGAMAGGILGPMLANGNKTMGGLIGAGTGAAAGALAGTFLFPGVGTLVGALLGGAGGGLGGLLGTQKASVGPLSSGNLGFNTDGSLWERGVFQDNKGDTAVADAALNATQQLMTGVKSLGGTFDQFSVNFSSFSKDGKTFWRINGADGPTVSQSSDTNVALKDLVKWMSEHKLDGTSEVAGQMLRWSDPNIRKAIAASDAADITGLLKDIDFGATFDGVFKRLKAGLSSTTPALDAMRKAADDLGSTVQTQIVDWRDSAVRLGFATAEELNPMLRSAIREMAGLGTATEPLMGIAAAEEQARLNAAALQPALEAVGATAEEQAQLLTDMVTKARNDYQSEVDFLTRQGQTLYASASDPTARLSAADQFRASGLVPNVAAPGLDGLIAAFDAVERAASRGDINAMAFSDAIAKANAMLQAGALTADQYGTVIQAVAADMSRALAVRDAGISGRIAVERAIDPKYAASAVDVMALQHVGAAGVAALAQPFQTFIDQAKGGTATADGLRGTWAALQAQMAAGNLTAEQTTGLLSALTDAYAASGTAANDAARAVEEAATSLAAAVEKTRQAQSAAGELAARRADLLGDTTDAALKRFDLQAAAELQGATASGVDVATLRGVLASERAQLAFQQAQQSYLTAIDREIQARQDSTTALQNSALKLKQIADGFKAANDNLRLSDKSDLSPLQRLEEVRRQFEQALTDYRAANDNDVKASLAQKIQDLGNSRVDIAAGYYQTTDYSDYRRVLAVFDQLSIANDNTATTAEETIRQNDQIIAQLTQTRRTAEQLGQAQLGSLESLKTAMDGAKATLDAQLAALKGIGGNTTTVDSQSDAIIRAATVEAGRNFTGQFKDGQYGAYALSQYGSYSAGGFANITSGSTIAAMLRLVTGYTGDFADGKFPAWIKSGAVSPMQAEAAREILRRNNIEPTFAAGGLVTGGTPGVDSVRAWLMPGERVLSVPHSAMLERIYGMATMATAGSRPVANDPLPANIIAMPAAPQQSPPELAELVALLRELIALIGAQQLKALMQTGAIGDATVGKLEEVIEQLDELGYSLKVKKAGG